MSGRRTGLARIPSGCTATPGKNPWLSPSLFDVDRLALHHDIGGVDFAPGDTTSCSCGAQLRNGFSDRAHGIACSGGHCACVGRSLVLSRRLFPVGRSRRDPGIDMDNLEVAETQLPACKQFAPVCRRHSLIAGAASFWFLSVWFLIFIDGKISGQCKAWAAGITRLQDYLR